MNSVFSHRNGVLFSSCLKSPEVFNSLHLRADRAFGDRGRPALELTLGNLEAELKVKLFHRTTRRTWLTKAGTRLFSEAKRILTDIEVTTSSLRFEGDEPESVRLALGEDLAGEPFTRMLSELEHHQGGTLVEVRELTHGEASRLVRDGGADVALTLDRRPFEGLQQRRGWGEPLMLILPVGHRLAKCD